MASPSKFIASRPPAFKLAYEDQSGILIVKSEAILRTSTRLRNGTTRRRPNCHQLNSIDVTPDVCSKSAHTLPVRWPHPPKPVSIHSRNISGQIPVESTSVSPSPSGLIYLKAAAIFLKCHVGFGTVNAHLRREPRALRTPLRAKLNAAWF